MWSSPHSPARRARLALALAGAAGALVWQGCASHSQPAAGTGQWAASVRDTAGQAAELAVQSARKAGRVVTTAARGVANGFDEPDPAGQGRLVEVAVHEDALFERQAHERE